MHCVGVIGSLIFLAPPKTSRLHSIWVLGFYSVQVSKVVLDRESIFQMQIVWTTQYPHEGVTGEGEFFLFIEGYFLNLNDVTLNVFLYC